MDVKSVIEGNSIPAKEIKSGGNRPGLINKSKDAINWVRPEVGYQINTLCFGDKLVRTECPHICVKMENRNLFFGFAMKNFHRLVFF